MLVVAFPGCGRTCVQQQRLHGLLMQNGTCVRMGGETGVGTGRKKEVLGRRYVSHYG